MTGPLKNPRPRKSGVIRVPDVTWVMEMTKLNAAIFDSACTFCGASPGIACRQKPRTDHPPTSTMTSHMVRVRAGHALLRERRK